MVNQVDSLTFGLISAQREEDKRLRQEGTTRRIAAEQQVRNFEQEATELKEHVTELKQQRARERAEHQEQLNNLRQQLAASSG